VSFVVYNEGTIAASFNLYVYNSAGALVATGTTPSIPPLQSLGGGIYGEGGTYGATLRTVITGGLPSGVFKILIDGGTVDSAVQMFQFTGPSLSSMQVAYDSAPSSTAVAAAAVRQAHAGRARKVSNPKRVFDALPQ
jgi:hypothetical protein